MQTILEFRSPSEQPSVDEEFYLQQELKDLIRTDDGVFNFIESGSLDGIWYWDLVYPENEYMSERFWEVLGYDPSEKRHLASEWHHIINQDDLKLAEENFEKHCADPNHPYDQLVRYRHADGSTVWIRCRGIAIRDNHGTPIRMLGAHNDVTAIMNLRENQAEVESLKKVNQQLLHAARYDSLTRLNSREGLVLAFPSQVALAAEFERPISVLLMEVDGFSHIKDQHGHLLGDKVLIAFSRILHEVVPERGFAARLDGCRFCVAMPECDREEAMQIANAITEKVRPTKVNGIELQFTVSIGVTTIVVNLTELAQNGYALHRFLTCSERGLRAAHELGGNQALYECCEAY